MNKTLVQFLILFIILGCQEKEIVKAVETVEFNLKGYFTVEEVFEKYGYQLDNKKLIYYEVEIVNHKKDTISIVVSEDSLFYGASAKSTCYCNSQYGSFSIIDNFLNSIKVSIAPNEVKQFFLKGRLLNDVDYYEYRFEYSVDSVIFSKECMYKVENNKIISQVDSMECFQTTSLIE